MTCSGPQSRRGHRHLAVRAPSATPFRPAWRPELLGSPPWLTRRPPKCRPTLASSCVRRPRSPRMIYGPVTGPADLRRCCSWVVNVTPDSFSDGGRYLARRRRGPGLLWRDGPTCWTSARVDPPGAVDVEERSSSNGPAFTRSWPDHRVPISVDTRRRRFGRRRCLRGEHDTTSLPAHDPDLSSCRRRRGPAGADALLVTPRYTGRPPHATFFFEFEASSRALPPPIRRGRARSPGHDPGIGFGNRDQDTTPSRRPPADPLRHPLLGVTSRKAFSAGPDSPPDRGSRHTGVSPVVWAWRAAPDRPRATSPRSSLGADDRAMLRLGPPPRVVNPGVQAAPRPTRVPRAFGPSTCTAWMLLAYDSESVQPPRLDVIPAGPVASLGAFANSPTSISSSPTSGSTSTPTPPGRCADNIPSAAPAAPTGAPGPGHQRLPPHGGLGRCPAHGSPSCAHTGDRILLIGLRVRGPPGAASRGPSAGVRGRPELAVDLAAAGRPTTSTDCGLR